MGLLGRLPVGLAVLAVLVNLVSRPTPGLDTRVTSTIGGTGPTSDIGIEPFANPDEQRNFSVLRSARSVFLPLAVKSWSTTSSDCKGGKN